MLNFSASKRSRTTSVTLIAKSADVGRGKSLQPIRTQPPRKAHVAHRGVMGRKRLGTSLHAMSPITPPNVPVMTPKSTATKGATSCSRAISVPRILKRPRPSASGKYKNFSTQIGDTRNHRHGSGYEEHNHRIPRVLNPEQRVTVQQHIAQCASTERCHERNGKDSDKVHTFAACEKNSEDRAADHRGDFDYQHHGAGFSGRECSGGTVVGGPPSGAGRLAMIGLPVRSTSTHSTGFLKSRRNERSRISCSWIN